MPCIYLAAIFPTTFVQRGYAIENFSLYIITSYGALKPGESLSKEVIILRNLERQAIE